MNYLAHSLLAEPYAHSLIGNLAGDLVKGPLATQGLDIRVAAGVRRHRSVDALTDRHPRHRRLRELFPGSQRRYAGIVLDVLFDHLLSRHWSQFCSWPREDFTRSVYAVLTQNPHLQPRALAAVSPRWVSADWLGVYDSIDGVAAVLARVSQRLRRPVDLVSMLDLLQDHEPELEDGFIEIFSAVQASLGAPSRTAIPCISATHLPI